jgi:hypothetical protein
LDQALSKLSYNLDQFRDAIETAEPSLRPAYDREYARILALAASYAPESSEAIQFQSAARDATPYGETLPYKATGLGSPELRAMVTKSLDETGIDAGEVLARVSLGADSQYLETQWVIRDLQTIARSQGVDLNEDLARVQHRLEGVYGELRADFVQIGALSEDANVHGARIDPLASSGPVHPVASPTNLSVNALLDHHRSGARGVPEYLRQGGAAAIKAALSETEYREVLCGRTQALETFTDDRAERLFLGVQVLKHEVAHNGRGDLQMVQAQINNEYRRAMTNAHDKDHGW